MDYSVSDEDILKGEKTMSEWIIPCNIEQYDVFNAFKKFKKLDWKQSTNVEINDYIYIYVGKPYGAIAFKCRVIKINLEEINIDDSEFVLNDTNFGNYGRYMELELIERYNTRLLDNLKRCGLKTVQGPSIISHELSQYINGIDGESRVVTFSSAVTYELAMKCNVHAHPLKSGYPTKVLPYLVLRNTGGVMECIFNVDYYVDVNLNQIELVKSKLSERDYRNLVNYVKERSEKYDFKYGNKLKYSYIDERRNEVFYEMAYGGYL